MCPLIHSDFIWNPYGSLDLKFLLRIYSIICLLSDGNLFMPIIFFKEFQMEVFLHCLNYFKGRKVTPIVWSLSFTAASLCSCQIHPCCYQTAIWNIVTHNNCVCMHVCMCVCEREREREYVYMPVCLHLWVGRRLKIMKIGLYMMHAW